MKLFSKVESSRIFPQTTLILRVLTRAPHFFIMGVSSSLPRPHRSCFLLLVHCLHHHCPLIWLPVVTFASPLAEIDSPFLAFSLNLCASTDIFSESPTSTNLEQSLSSGLLDLLARSPRSDAPANEFRCALPEHRLRERALVPGPQP